MKSREPIIEAHAGSPRAPTLSLRTLLSPAIATSVGWEKVGDTKAAGRLGERLAPPLVFEVPGEGLREIEGGLETTSGHENAWSMQRVQRQ